MKAITIYIALILGITFSACEKVQKVEDFPKHQSKLVVNSLFEVDSVWRLTFSKSLSPLDNARFRILDNQNAYAVIFENGRVLDTIIFNTNIINYEAKYISKLGTSPQPGHQYEIKTYYPGEAETTAREYLPEKPAITDLKMYTKSYQEIDNGGGYKYKTIVKNVSFSLSDDKANNDFYVISIWLETTRDSNSTIYYQSYVNMTSDSKENNSEITNGNGVPVVYITESFGSKILGKISLDLTLNEYYQDTATKNKIVLTMKRMGENAFKYNLAASKQYQNQNDPFAQPSPIWNNINGGYGIFGGFCLTKFEFHF